MTAVGKYKTRTEAAQVIGVRLSFLSMVLNGAPLTGKIVDFLGFQKIKGRTFRRKEN